MIYYGYILSEVRQINILIESNATEGDNDIKTINKLLKELCR